LDENRSKIQSVTHNGDGCTLLIGTFNKLKVGVLIIFIYFMGTGRKKTIVGGE
jgi:hypothetical protein